MDNLQDIDVKTQSYTRNSEEFPGKGDSGVFTFSGNEEPCSDEFALIHKKDDVRASDLPAPTKDNERRPLQVVIALSMIVALAPVFLLLSGLLLITDRGPILYRQKRVGLGGRQFDCLKFRTMRVDADRALSELLERDPDLRRQWNETRKLDKDPRITAIGKFLRMSSLDELPQLFNVVAGDINLVGPRPIVEAELPCYGRYLSYYLGMRPGLTGLWQISGRSSTTYRRRVAADVYYARQRTPTLDLYIILATVPAVLFARGAA